MALDHGGRLNAAAARYGIDRGDWLDLSTGISPWSWPVPALPESIWRRLPEDDDGLDAISRRWTAAPADLACLPVAGSQAAIQVLPRILSARRVGVLVPAYAEHRRCWAEAGHAVYDLEAGQIEARLRELDVLVLVRPNNPDGWVAPIAQVSRWRAALAARGGLLVVDEAFIEAGPSVSLIDRVASSGLVVLRSFGKFFGLAGLRAGLLIGPPELVAAVTDRLGPWQLSGPARFIMRQALADLAWQHLQKERLKQQSRRLRRLLADCGLPDEGGCWLFRYIRHAQAAAIRDALARQGILVRHFEQPAALRMGLPADDAGLQRLGHALAAAGLKG